MKKILLLSDLHVGSVYGLWPEGMTEEDPQNGEVKGIPPTNVNQKIGSHWDLMLKSVRETPPEVVIWNGDLIEGPQDFERGKGLLTRNIDLQEAACIKMIQSVRDAAPDAVFYFTAGTGYHQRSDGHSVDRHIAAHFNAEFGNELVIEECGIRIFARHVISSSSSTWQYMATAPGREHLLLYVNKGKEDEPGEEKYGPIDVAVFSHRHQFVVVGFPSGIALVTPCWQSKTPYASVRKGLMGVPDIGWVFLEVHDRKRILIDKTGIKTVVRPCKTVGRDLVK
jgi:hypothetical protein